jgi:hypothetical protein
MLGQAMTHEAIKALVGLEDLFKVPEKGFTPISMPPHQRGIVLAAIEALKPIAEETVVDGKSIEQWVERNFEYKSIAHRREDEPALPGEPFIPTELAIKIAVNLVKKFAAASPAPSKLEIDGTSQDFYDCEGSDVPTPSDDVKKPLNLHFNNDYLLKKIDEDGDYECEAGIAPSDEGVVERMAKAMYELSNYYGPWGKLDPKYKEIWFTQARAALAALKEGE